MLSPSELILLPFNQITHIVVLAILLSLLFVIADVVEFLSLLVSLGTEQLLYLFAHVHQVFGEGDFDALLLSDLLVQLLDLEQVLLLEFLKTQVSSGLIVGHVVVPSRRELEELGSLSRLNSDELLLLGLLHVLQLSQHLLVLEILELKSRSSGLSEVHLLAALLPVVIEQPQEVHNLRVRQEVDTSSGKEAAVLLTLPHVAFSALSKHVSHEVAVEIRTERHLPFHLVLFRGYESVFKVLHDPEELLEAHETIWIEVHLLQKVDGFLWISTERLHYSLQVSNVDKLGVLLVKHIEDAPVVLNLLLRVLAPDVELISSCIVQLSLFGIDI